MCSKGIITVTHQYPYDTGITCIPTHDVPRNSVPVSPIYINYIYYNSLNTVDGIHLYHTYITAIRIPWDAVTLFHIVLYVDIIWVMQVEYR
jgi:hypothetical protein